MYQLKNICNCLILLLLVVSLLFNTNLGFPLAEATSWNEYFVAPNGDDSNPGTLDEPWKTVQYAIDTVNPGDIIHLRSGTYHESLQFHQSGEQDNPITLNNYLDETVTIDGGANPAIIDRNESHYWTLEGLTLDSDAKFTIQFDTWGCDGTCRGTHHWKIKNNRIIGAVQIYGSYNLLEGNEVDGSQHKGSENAIWELYDVSHHNVFRDNHIHDFYIRGIWSMHRTHDSIFENNHIHHIGDDTEGMCIDMDGFGTVEWRHVIRGNHLHHCAGIGIVLENTFDGVVENNIIHDIGRMGIDIINYGPHIGPDGKKCEAGGENDQYGDTDGDNDCEGDITENIIRQNLIHRGSKDGAISIHLAGGIRIWGNTIANVVGYGIVLYGDNELCPEIDVHSNIIADSGKIIISIEEVASLILDHHNMLYPAGSEDVYQIRSSGTSYTLSEYQDATGKGEGSIQADPRFINPGANNFHLQAVSPAIDSGVNIGLTTDLDGNPRPRGAGYDIGVYESTFTGATATPAPSLTLPPPSPTTTSSPTTAPPSPTLEPSISKLTLTPTQVNINSGEDGTLDNGNITNAGENEDKNTPANVGPKSDSGEKDDSVFTVVWEFVVDFITWAVDMVKLIVLKIRQFFI